MVDFGVGLRGSLNLGGSMGLWVFLYVFLFDGVSEVDAAENVLRGEDIVGADDADGVEEVVESEDDVDAKETVGAEYVNDAKDAVGAESRCPSLAFSCPRKFP